MTFVQGPYDKYVKKNSFSQNQKKLSTCLLCITWKLYICVYCILYNTYSICYVLNSYVNWHFAIIPMHARVHKVYCFAYLHSTVFPRPLWELCSLKNPSPPLIFVSQKGRQVLPLNLNSGSTIDFWRKMLVSLENLLKSDKPPRRWSPNLEGENRINPRK